MANDFIGFRVTPEVRAHITAHAESQGVTVSEYVRALVMQAITGQTPSIDEGYMQARGLAIQLCHALLNEATALLPPTYEEASKRFELAGPGRNGRVPVSPSR